MMLHRVPEFWKTISSLLSPFASFLSPSGSLNSLITLKATSLLSHAPDDELLFPEQDVATGLFRVRLGLRTKHSDWMNTELAYEQRARASTEAAATTVGAGILPSVAEAPFRITQLDWQLAEADNFSYRHEFDRALVALHPGCGEVTVGRQAIGLGRGVLFGAVDIFSPFSPIEVDREWRRGVDAARVEYRVSDTSSVEAVAAFGESWEESALLGRLRGYVGEVDGELIFGKRAEDEMVGGTISAAVGDAEMHIELAIFDTPEEQPDGGLFGDDTLVGKAVVGSSYTFDVGNGLTLLGEYHYSGFGVKDIEDIQARFFDPIFQERFLRGDTQILGRHAVALRSNYPFSNILSGGILILMSPVDGSGLFSPSAVWDMTQNVSLAVSGFIPWGAEPSNGQLRSEYGSSPASLFLQISAYF
ncbi:MAG: hypothetical protein HY801_09385 [Candidatus Lindowbacteria bacterium]|nr:hypothetical protein [Candidatus Lindowbacteria bacterium]